MRCLIITLFLILSCITLSQAVELDSDSNGAIDVNKGGTNATTTTQAKLNLGLSNVDNTSDANKPVSTATQTALNLKANASCFADTASFNDCFTLDWPTGGTTYTAGTGITITDGVIASTVVDTDTFASWDKDYNDLINKPTIPDISGKEDSLGNPSVNGYVLSSTTSGVRSWVEMTGGGTGIAHATADGNYYASKDGGWASLTGLYAPALGADDNYVTDAEKTKIAGIAEGAEVNVNADWNSSSGDSQILNKPTIVTTVGATGADTNIPSEQAVREALNLKADIENIAFLAGVLTDLKIKTTAQPTNGEPLIDDTVTYGATDDNLRLWSIDKIGSELTGKAASDHTHTGVYEPAGVTESDISDLGTAVYLKTAIDTQGEVETIWGSNLTNTIASGTASMGTSEIANNSCATVVTVSATGVATTDIINMGFNGTPVGVTGYDPTGTPLNIIAYPTANNVNFLVCNSTGAAVTPGALTINWRVDR